MELWLLKSIHVVTSGLWVGFAVLLGLFVFPALGEAGPAGAPVMGGLMKRRLVAWINAFALLAILTGLRLYMKFFSADWLSHPSAMVLTAGAVAGLAAFSLGHAVARPTAKKLGALSAAVQAQGGPPSAEQAAQLKALQAKGAWAGKLNAILLLVAFICMASVRYLPLG